MVSVSDPVTWAWERSTSRTPGWTPVSGATSASYTTVDADANHYLRATASYDDGAGAGKSASAVSANPVRALAPGNNDPSFPSATDTRTVDENERAGSNVGAPFVATDTRTVDENEPAGSNVGAPFVATDADNDRLSYFLSGTDAAAFEINPSSGQLRTRTVLDYETKQSYQVDVTATDPSGGFGEVAVTISVGNVQEAGTVRLSLQEPVVEIQLTATLDDPDGSLLVPSSWLWERSPDRASWTTVGGGTSAATLHAAGRRCGRLPAGHRLLRRWSRRRPERRGSLGPPRAGAAGTPNAGLQRRREHHTRHDEDRAPGREHRRAGCGYRRRQRPPLLQPGRAGHGVLRHRRVLRPVADQRRPEPRGQGQLHRHRVGQRRQERPGQPGHGQRRHDRGDDHHRGRCRPSSYRRRRRRRRWRRWRWADTERHSSSSGT